jgi:hypothetical protein
MSSESLKDAAEELASMMQTRMAPIALLLAQGQPSDQMLADAFVDARGAVILAKRSSGPGRSAEMRSAMATTLAGLGPLRCGLYEMGFAQQQHVDPG